MEWLSYKIRLDVVNPQATKYARRIMLNEQKVAMDEVQQSGVNGGHLLV